MMTSAECVFFHARSCDHTGRACTSPCRLFLREIKGLSYRDHFDIFYKRRTQRVEMRVKWVTIIISLLALTVSIANVGWQIMKDSNKSEGFKQGHVSNGSTMGPEKKGRADKK